MEFKYFMTLFFGVLLMLILIFFQSFVAFLVQLKIIDLPDTLNLNIIKTDIGLEDFPKQLNGLILVQLSDLHYSQKNKKFIEYVINKTNELNPDIICLTGDLIHNDKNEVENLMKLLGRLSASIGIYAVFGNHEIQINKEFYLSKMQEFTKIKLLENQSQIITIKGMNFGISGFGEVESKRDYQVPQPEQTLSQIPENMTRIVLCHNPDVFQNVTDKRVDLMLSGHTHGQCQHQKFCIGGQIRLPIVGPILPIIIRILNVLPKSTRKYIPYSQHFNVVKHLNYFEGIFKEQRKGNEKKKNILNISRGIGSSPKLFRFFCTPEINVFKLFQK